MVTLTSAPRATDWDCILDDARATLIANATIAATLPITASPTDPNGGKIASNAVAEGTASPYIVLALIPTYESTYGIPGINGLLDISCYAEGWGTRTVRALMKAALSALLDGAWVTTAMAAEGVRLISANAEEPGTGGRPADTVTNGVMVRGKQFTIRVRAAKF
jgi:hypothetical protein